MIAKAHYGKAVEIPYVFTDRTSGTSKLNSGEIANYSPTAADLCDKAFRWVERPRVGGGRRHESQGQDGLMPIPDWLRSLREKNVPAEDAALWVRCPSCGEMLYRKDLEPNQSVCMKCGRYDFRMHAYDRINALVDGDFVEIGAEMLPGDPLEWTDRRPYPQKISRAIARSRNSAKRS